MHYQPTRESVSTHPVPDWFHDAKFGIFVHWGLYSVPAWAPLAADLGHVIESGDWSTWFRDNPYAEWYLNSLRIDGSPTQQFHAETYGEDFSYFDFAAMFNEASKDWDPTGWASLFKRSGARYVVPTTKHHDGFLLWPSRHPNPFIENYQTERDLIGELGDAVRDAGMTYALYYSGGLDWTFYDKVIVDIADLPAGVPQMAEYIDYANAHWRELFERYGTKILWNDIAYPRDTDLNVLFADYYNQVPDGLVNNRFTQTFSMEQGNIVSDNHHDFETPEYASFSEIREKKWESCRGIGASFGYNRIEGVEQYQSVESLVRSLVNIVSKNGNLLLNVGPMADGTIPPMQVERLEGIGRWLEVNGEAIYATRPWTVAESSTDGGIDVRFTQAGGSLFATLLDTPDALQFEIGGLKMDESANVQLLGRPGELAWRQTDGGVAISMTGGLADAPAHALKITPAPDRMD